MKNTILTILLLFNLICISGQDLSFHNLSVDRILIDSGKYKNYYRYDLGETFLFLGRFENNLKLKISDKSTNSILFYRIDTLSDAMILKPKFFKSDDNLPLILMIETAAEYSWDQEIVLIAGKDIKSIGHLDYSVNLENETSIANYCHFKYSFNKIVMTFDDVPIIHGTEDSKIINAGDLVFELHSDGIKRIK